MANNPKIVGTIEHNETTREENVVIQETWTIPAFKERFYGNTITEIQSPTSPSGLTVCEFQLAIKGQFLTFYSEFSEIHIFYKSSKTVFLESIQLMLIGSNSGLMIPSEIMTWPNSIVEAKKWRGFIRAVEAKKWRGYIRLSTTVASNLIGINNVQPESNLQLCFKFVVSIKKSREIPTTQLTNDFKNLLNAGMFSDVVMKSVEGEEFRVHKAVLASRSAVLKAHFEHNTTETITNIVESPLESEGLREVLSFIYTDETPKVDEFPEKLLAAADYYQLSRLKSLCEEALLKKLVVNNAIEILQLADLHSADTLKKRSLQFIKKDLENAKLITVTEGWANLKDVELIKKIHE